MQDLFHRTIEGVAVDITVTGVEIGHGRGGIQGYITEYNSTKEFLIRYDNRQCSMRDMIGDISPNERRTILSIYSNYYNID